MEREKENVGAIPVPVIRRFDRGFRIVLPVDIRKAMSFSEGDQVELKMLSGDELLVRKYDPLKNKLNDFADIFVPVLTDVLQAPVAICDMQHILVDAGAMRSYAGMKTSPQLIDLIINNHLPTQIEPCRIVDGEDQTASYIAPIVNGRNYGAILVLDNGNKPADGVLLVLDTVAGILAEQMQGILDPGSEE